MIPALDTAAFEQLAEDLGSYTVASDFLATFASLLTDRIQRIERSLIVQDEAELVTALLSLQASAAMSGAAQLQASATRTLAQQPVGSTPTGPLVRRLQGQADAFRDALAGFHHAGCAPDTRARHSGGRSSAKGD
ncbi:hypothetical protein [Arthrobacter sp. NPDC092385]|uniref:hypothetical protein n=1 Tax=Arthrobacter sp. NPDC092385 TaxID=3363943 RepID=UPI003828671B